MKFVIGLLLAGIGYAAFDPTARAVVMSQSTGWIIGEYICAHVVIAVFVGMEFYAAMTVNILKQRDRDGYDGAASFWERSGRSLYRATTLDGMSLGVRVLRWSAT